MESQELSSRHGISLEMARSELEAEGKCAPYESVDRNQQFQIPVRENPGQARDAVYQAVQEFSESYEVPMMQEIQSVQNRYEGRMEENSRVAHMIGSEAREA